MMMMMAGDALVLPLPPHQMQKQLLHHLHLPHLRIHQSNDGIEDLAIHTMSLSLSFEM